MKRKTAIAVISLSLSLSLLFGGCSLGTGAHTGPGTSPTGNPKEEEKSGTKLPENLMGQGSVGDRWLASSVYGAVSDNTVTSEKDDFFTAKNLDYFLQTVISPGYSSGGVFVECDGIMKQRTLALVTDPEGVGHDAELVRNLFALATDWDNRNKGGIEDFEKEAEEIENIKTIEDLSAYIASPDTFHPGLFSCSVENTFSTDGKYMINILPTPLLLGDSAEYTTLTENGELTRNYQNAVVLYLYKRLNRSEEEIQAMLDHCEAFEKKLSEHIYTVEQSYAEDIYDHIINPRTLKELKKEEGELPLTEAIEAFGWGGAKKCNLEEPDWLNALKELYTEEELENIKAYLYVHLAGNMIGKLDREAYDVNVGLINEQFGSSGLVSDEETGLAVVGTYLSEPLDYAYIDNFCSEEEREKVISLVKEFADYYKEMLQGEEWLSKKTRKKAIQKLDKLKIRACYPDKRVDYSGLNYAGPSEGGSLVEAYRQITLFNRELGKSRLNKKPDPDLWTFSTREVNAWYDPTDNSFTILCGALVGPFSLNQDEEVILATVGAETIGHEVSHVFDTAGAQFDKDGNYVDWWADEDKAVFEARSEPLVNYLSGIVPFSGADPINGQQFKTEMIADLAGMKAALALASKRENFDYDEFFTAAARGWAQVNTIDTVLWQLSADTHPLENLRVNIPLQQSPEFIETYGIQKGDGMYLAEEDRLNVW